MQHPIMVKGQIYFFKNAHTVKNFKLFAKSFALRFCNDFAVKDVDKCILFSTQLVEG